jgi:hypothetical protein
MPAGKEKPAVKPAGTSAAEPPGGEIILRSQGGRVTRLKREG